MYFFGKNARILSMIFFAAIFVMGLTIGAGPEKTQQVIDSSVKTVKEATDSVIQKVKETTK